MKFNYNLKCFYKSNLFCILLTNIVAFRFQEAFRRSGLGGTNKLALFLRNCWSRLVSAGLFIMIMIVIMIMFGSKVRAWFGP